MSYCRQDGKDKIVFLTKEEESKTSPAPPPPPTSDEGLIKADGQINWDCPCLQGMADGPCGEVFKESFSCFHYSTTEPKGVDCIEHFKAMQECFLRHPDVYGGLDDESTKDQSNVESERKVEVLDEKCEVAGKESSASASAVQTSAASLATSKPS